MCKDGEAHQHITGTNRGGGVGEVGRWGGGGGGGGVCASRSRHT